MAVVRATQIDTELNRHVMLERKPSDLYGVVFNPQLEIELDAAEWNDLLGDPMKSREWLRGPDKVLVVGPSGAGMIAIDTQGADYARYATRIA